MEISPAAFKPKAQAFTPVAHTMSSDDDDPLAAAMAAAAGDDDVAEPAKRPHWRRRALANDRRVQVECLDALEVIGEAGAPGLGGLKNYRIYQNDSII